MFAKNVFGSRLESIICKTKKNACVRVRLCARHALTVLPSLSLPPYTGAGKWAKGGA